MVFKLNETVAVPSDNEYQPYQKYVIAAVMDDGRGCARNDFDGHTFWFDLETGDSMDMRYKVVEWTLEVEAAYIIQMKIKSLITTLQLTRPETITFRELDSTERFIASHRGEVR